MPVSSNILRLVEETILEASKVESPFTYSAFSLSGISDSTAYEVFVPIPSLEITTFASSGGEKTSGGVKATLKVDYVHNAAGDQIKVNKIYGNWKPISTMYSVSNRSVGMHSSFAAGGKKLQKYPTTNSFSYNTG